MWVTNKTAFGTRLRVTEKTALVTRLRVTEKAALGTRLRVTDKTAFGTRLWVTGKTALGTRLQVNRKDNSRYKTAGPNANILMLALTSLLEASKIKWYTPLSSAQGHHLTGLM